jgi:3-phenylpropionate/trans-cinnamate dioxygenase ferredoxin reductase subunit
MSGPIVIIGAGTAGLRCAEALRRLGFDGPVTMIGDERYLPYQRPPLSKKFLSGEVSEEQLWLSPAEFFARDNIELLTGSQATEIDRRAGEVVLRDGKRLPFAKLLIATGSRPRPLPVAGFDLAGVYTLRGIDDVMLLREAAAPAKRIAIIGGGYIGLEVAAMLRQMGRDVVLLEAQARLLQRVVCSEVSRFFHDLHTKQGVDIRCGIAITRLIGKTHVTAIETSEGQVAADVVLVAIGGQPNDEIARDAGLATDAGIIVDERGMAAETIYAAGDCARFPSRRYGMSVRLESVQNATDQARAVAANMLGRSQTYDPVPWFWSDQYDVKLQIAGLCTGYDRTERDGGSQSKSFSVSYFAGERLLSVDAINAPRSHMMARRRLAEAVPNPAEGPG